MKQLLEYWHLVVVSLTLFIGCTVYPISQRYRDQAQTDVSIKMAQADPQKYKGSTVIWGGFILKDRNDSTGSTLTILETPLDYQSSPKPRSYSRGRFIAVTNEFLDPVIFPIGKRVTLAASVEGVETRELGEGTYAYPIVKILQLRTWQDQPSTYFYGYPYYYDYPGWYFGYYGPAYDYFFWNWDGGFFRNRGFYHRGFGVDERIERRGERGEEQGGRSERKGGRR